jgi:hypothetical protein
MPPSFISGAPALSLIPQLYLWCPSFIFDAKATGDISTHL